MKRYEKNYGELITPEDQKILLTKTIAVLGAGGNGGFVLEYLARLGVKKIIIFDGDSFDISNLNRQIYCNETTLGKNKAEVAANYLHKINSNIEIEAFPFFAGSNLKKDFDILNKVDFIFDCCDYGDYNPKNLVTILIEILKENPNIGITSSSNTPLGGVSSIHTQKTLDMYIDIQKNYVLAFDEKSDDIIGQPAYMCALTAANDVAAAVKFLCNKNYNLVGELYHYDLYHFKTFKIDKFGLI